MSKIQTTEEKLEVAMNTIKALNERLVNTRACSKEFSDCFVNKKKENQAFKNLSETKRHLESKHETTLKAVIKKVRDSNEKIDNDDFNKVVVAVFESYIA